MKYAVLNSVSGYVTGNKTDFSNVNDMVIHKFIDEAYKQKTTAISLSVLLKNQSSLSSRCKNSLQMLQVRNIAIQTRKTEKFLNIYQQFAQAGIQPLCVKGLACSVLYPNLDIRESSDEDLLVEDKNYDKCVEILKSNNFESIGDDTEKYVQTFIDRKTECMIDLHHSLFPTDKEIYCKFNSYFDKIFDNKRHIEINNVQISVPGYDDLLLYLIIHSFKHFIYSGVGIRQVADISLAVNSFEVDFERIFNICEELNMVDFFSALLKIGNKYFGLNIDKILCDKFNNEIDEADLLDDILNGGVYGSTNEDHIRSNTFTFNEYTKSVTNEGKSFLKAVFLPKEKMQGRYPYAKKYPYLLPISYANRIIDYFKKDHSISTTLTVARERISLLNKYGIIK